MSRFRQGAAECSCADPFSISCPVHNKESESGPRSRAKGEEINKEEVQVMLNGHRREEVIKQSGKTDPFNQNLAKREIHFRIPFKVESFHLFISMVLMVLRLREIILLLNSFELDTNES